MSSDVGQDDRDPETIALFTEESLEGLQQLEELLVSAERGEVPKDMLGTLFRTVHTIKGTAGYLAYTRTQELSHTAEDLLSKMRDGKIVPAPVHYSCLIEVSDRLKTLVNNVKASNEEGEVEVATLVKRLTSLTNGAVEAVREPPNAAVSNQQATSPAAVASPPAVAVPDVVVLQAEPSTLHTDAIDATMDAVSDKKEAPATASAESVDGTVRVNVSVLDRLMDLIGELVLARNQMVQMVKTTTDGNVSTQSVFQRLNVVTSDLQEQVMKTRMQPVARVFEKIPRIVRDVSRVTAKQVNTIIEGNATEIDKALVEAIRDPVMHIVRNAVDHGIESESERLALSKPKIGSLYIRAAHKGGAVTIEVEDDGRGMDPKNLREHALKKGIITPAEASKMSDRESLDLVFRAGFSTARQVTDISGRGVGMDVVRTHVERAGGKAEIESSPGRGTIIRLKMPLTMAIIPALLVRAQHQRFAIPQANLLELVYLTEDQRRHNIETVRGAAIHKLRGEFIPVVDLSKTLGLASDDATLTKPDTNIVILSSGARRYSLIVDAIENTEEIVLKPLKGQLKRISCYSGATVLGDGGVALILDVPGMAAKSGIDLTKDYKPDSNVSTAAKVDTDLVMIFTIGNKTQCAIPLSMVARLEQVEVDKIERIGRSESFQYRKQVVPIIRPEELVTGEMPPEKVDSQLLIVFDFGSPIAMAVEEVIDVGHIPQSQGSQRSTDRCILEKTVVFGKTTLLLDIYNLVIKTGPSLESKMTLAPRKFKVVTLLPAAAMRSSLESMLQRSGIGVTSCASEEHFLKELKKQSASEYAAFVVDLPDDAQTSQKVLTAIRAKNSSSPVIRWGGATQTHENQPQTEYTTSFTATDRDQLLECLYTLSGNALGIKNKVELS